jgi:predicted MFS family arabinose efflux permease
LGISGALGLGRFGYSAVLPDMQDALGLTGAQAGSLASWNLAGNTFMAFLGGLLATRFSARRVVSAGMAVTAVGMVLTGFAPNLAGASAARLVTGVGNGMVYAPSLALMAGWFHGSQLGLASTVVASGNGLGLVLAGPVVPRIIAAGGASGWRWAWYFFAAVTMVMAALTLAFERDRPGGPEARVRPSEPSKRSMLAELAAVMHSRYAWHLCAINFLYGFAYLIYLTFFQKRLITDLGFSDEVAGNLFLAVGAASLAGGVLWGMLSDRIGRGRALAGIMALQAVAGLLFSIRPTTAALIVSAVIFGSGVFGAPGLIGAACGDGFGPRLAYMSLGFVTIFIGVGMAIGPYVAGVLEDHFGRLGPSYLVSAGVFVAGAITAFLLRDVRKEAVRA